MFIFPVQLTTSRIGNLTRLIHTLLYVMTIHTYIHTYIHTIQYMFVFHTTCHFCDDRMSRVVIRPTLMGTKNLYENGPDPFFVFVFFDLMGTRMVQIRIAKSV